MPDPASYDCQRCGACCTANQFYADGYVKLSMVDVRRLSKAYRERHIVALEPHGFAHIPKPHLWLKTRRTTNDIRCVALRGRVGTKVTCSIYEQRPTACRSFKPGSPECRRDRAQAGIWDVLRGEGAGA